MVVAPRFECRAGWMDGMDDRVRKIHLLLMMKTVLFLNLILSITWTKKTLNWLIWKSIFSSQYGLHMGLKISKPLSLKEKKCITFFFMAGGALDVENELKVKSWRWELEGKVSATAPVCACLHQMVTSFKGSFLHHRHPNSHPNSYPNLTKIPFKIPSK